MILSDKELDTWIHESLKEPAFSRVILKRLILKAEQQANETIEVMEKFSLAQTNDLIKTVRPDLKLRVSPEQTKYVLMIAYLSHLLLDEAVTKFLESKEESTKPVINL